MRFTADFVVATRTLLSSKARCHARRRRGRQRGASHALHHARTARRFQGELDRTADRQGTRLHRQRYGSESRGRLCPRRRRGARIRRRAGDRRVLRRVSDPERPAPSPRGGCLGHGNDPGLLGVLRDAVVARGPSDAPRGPRAGARRLRRNGAARHRDGAVDPEGDRAGLRRRPGMGRARGVPDARDVPLRRPGRTCGARHGRIERAGAVLRERARPRRPECGDDRGHPAPRLARGPADPVARARRAGRWGRAGRDPAAEPSPVQVMVFVNTLLASLLRPGSISYLYYADRVMEFPLGIFGIALASASLPVMARRAAAGEPRALTETLGFSLRLALYASLPAMIGLVILRTPIVRVLFERGKFGPAETGATADALAWYAIGLVGFAGSRIAAQVFYALGQSGTAVRLGIVAVGANVLAALLMMGPLGHAGLAGASSVGAYVNLLALLYVARRRLGPLGGRALAASAARTLAASIPLIGWCALVLALWPPSRSLPVNIVWLGGAIAGGVALYWGASVVLGLSERTALLRMFPRAEPREGVGA